MTNAMMHESFYNSGTYINENDGIYIGWVSHRGSFDDCLPVTNETKNLLLFFSGENYIDNALLDHLKKKQHMFDASNASYLIHLYEEQGDDFYLTLNGFFSGILVDLNRQTLILFNDRFGMKRVYAYTDDDEFLFSNEAKSILRVQKKTRRLEEKNLGEYFSLGCALENNTIFSNIQTLECGSKWTFIKAEHVKKERYFSPRSWEDQPVLDESRYYTKLKETFRKILPRYIKPEENVAISLTGGLDTRMIMAYIDTDRMKPECYTFGGFYRDSYDVKIARKIARACGLRHQTLRIDDGFLKEFPDLVEKTIFVTDGNMNLNGAAMLFVNKMAREIAPVRLTGNYGSEIIRKVSNFKFNPPDCGLFSYDMRQNINLAAESFRSIKHGRDLSFTLFKQLPLYHYNSFSLEATQLMVRSPFTDNDFIEVAYRKPQSIDERALLLQLIFDGNKELGAMISDRGIKRNSIFPVSFIRHAYYEFLFKMEYYFNYGMPQFLSKLMYILGHRHLEKIFLGWHKYYHLRPIIRDTCSDYLNILLDQKTLSRSFFNKAFIEKMVNDHLKGYKNYTVEINTALSIELTCRLLLEQF